jgi:hypothetical protein
MKGQESIAVISVLILTLVGVGGLIQTNNLVFQVAQNNTGDYKTVLDADTRAQYYPYLLRKELNYSSNNLGIEPTVWEEDIPNFSEARREYRKDVKTRLGEQTDLIGCSSPDISKVSLNGTGNFTAVLSDRNVTCETENTRVSIPVDSEANLSVNNTKNRYIEALNYTSNYTRNLNNLISGNSTVPRRSYDVTGSASTYDCEDPDPSDAEERAIENAENNAEEEAREDAENELNNGNEIDNWVDMDLGLDASGECTTIEDTTSICTYTECSGDGDDEDCDTERGTTYSYTCYWETDEMVFRLEVLDNKFELTTKNGVENPVFKWDFIFNT